MTVQYPIISFHLTFIEGQLRISTGPDAIDKAVNKNKIKQNKKPMPTNSSYSNICNDLFKASINKIQGILNFFVKFKSFNGIYLKHIYLYASASIQEQSLVVEQWLSKFKILKAIAVFSLKSFINLHLKRSLQTLLSCSVFYFYLGQFDHLYFPRITYIYEETQIQL